MKNEHYYKNLRNKFLPDHLKTIFVLESPPESGKYFYDETGKTNEPLFTAMMRDVLFIEIPQTKREGLEEFAKRGYFLVDATYTPVDGIIDRLEKDRVILKNYYNLVNDLCEVIGGGNTKIILVKANICRLLGALLVEDGFNVVNINEINNGEVIPFPSNGGQRKFAEQIRKFL